MVAFTTEIAEPDKDGGALRYRGVDIEDLVSRQVTFGDVWALLVDGKFGHGLPPAEPFPLPIHSGDVRVDVQAGWRCWRHLGIPAAARHRRHHRARAAGPRLGDGAVLCRPVGARHLPARSSATNHRRMSHDHSTFHDALARRARPAPHRGRRRLLGISRRAWHERVDVHRTGDRIHRRRRGRRAVWAIGAMSGPLHGGAPARVLPMLEEVERTGDARGLVKGILDRGEKLMGFGHRVYRAEDPERGSCGRPPSGWALRATRWRWPSSRRHWPSCVSAARTARSKPTSSSGQRWSSISPECRPK
ncbi:citrate synthase family protein [Mycobacterium xenopi 3993]|nr:citrate synthase family protein [Mycobacterium xenopi 3993]